MSDPRKKATIHLQEQEENPQQVTSADSNISDESLKAIIEATIIQVCSRQMEKFEFASLENQIRRLAGEKQLAEHKNITGPYLEQIEARRQKIESKKDSRKAKLEQSRRKQAECLDKVVSKLGDLVQNSNKVESDQNVYQTIQRLREENDQQQLSIQELEAKIDRLSRLMPTPVQGDNETSAQNLLNDALPSEASKSKISLALIEVQTRLTEIENSMRTGTDARRILEKRLDDLDSHINKQAIANKAGKVDCNKSPPNMAATKSIEERIKDLIEDHELFKQDYVTKSNLEGYISIFNDYRQMSEERFNLHQRDRSEFARIDMFEASTSLLATEQKAREELVVTVRELSASMAAALQQLATLDSFRKSNEAETQDKEALLVKVQELSKYVPVIMGQQTTLQMHTQQLKQVLENHSTPLSNFAPLTAEDKRILEESRTLKRNIDQALGHLNRRIEGCNHSVMALNSRYNNLSSESLVRQMIPILDPYSANLKSTISKFQSELQAMREYINDNSAKTSELPGLMSNVHEMKLQYDNLKVTLDNVHNEVKQTSILVENEALKLRTDLSEMIEKGDESVNDSMLQKVGEQKEASTEALGLLLDKINDGDEFRRDLAQRVDTIDSSGMERYQKLLHDVLEVRKSIEDRLDEAENDIDETAKRIDKVEDTGQITARRFERLVNNLDETIENGVLNGMISNERFKTTSSIQRAAQQSSVSTTNDKRSSKATNQGSDHNSVHSIFTTTEESEASTDPAEGASRVDLKTSAMPQTVDLTGDEDIVVSPDLAIWGARTHHKEDVATVSSNATKVNSTPTKTGTLKRKRDTHHSASSESITARHGNTKSLHKKHARRV